MNDKDVVLFRALQVTEIQERTQNTELRTLSSSD